MARGDGSGGAARGVRGRREDGGGPRPGAAAGRYGGDRALGWSLGARDTRFSPGLVSCPTERCGTALCPTLCVPAPMEQCGDTGDKAAPFEMSLSHTAEWGQLCLTPTSVTLSYRSVQGYEDKAVSSVP